MILSFVDQYIIIFNFHYRHNFLLNQSHDVLKRKHVLLSPSLFTFMKCDRAPTDNIRSTHNLFGTTKFLWSAPGRSCGARL